MAGRKGRAEEELVCAICGNELDVERLDSRLTCLFCGAAQDSSSLAQSLRPPGPLHRVVNLERGRPHIDQALVRLDSAIRFCALNQVRVLTLIHGYGSSGRGGAIREEARHYLAYLCYQGIIREVIEGERFSPRQGPGRQLLRRFPFLKGHRDLGRANPGITVVVF